MSADLFGWVAAALMVSTFASREARVMRPLAVATNLAFIAYGALAALPPVLALHLLLLPINAWRWAQAHHLGSRELRMITVRCLRVLGIALLVLPLLSACGGDDAEPEPKPLKFVQVSRFVEISGIQTNGRIVAAGGARNGLSAQSALVRLLP